VLLAGMLTALTVRSRHRRKLGHRAREAVVRAELQRAAPRTTVAEPTPAVSHSVRVQAQSGTTQVGVKEVRP
jgi:hypothetical protein